jgi:hypothetical protein
MGMIRLQEARAGMVLAADVHDRTGRRLMVAGQETDDRALRVLRMWGVAELDVVGVEAVAAQASPAEPVDPAKSARLRREAEDLFRHTDRAHPAMAELFLLALAGRSAGHAWRA